MCKGGNDESLDDVPVDVVFEKFSLSSVELVVVDVFISSVVSFIDFGFVIVPSNGLGVKLGCSELKLSFCNCSLTHCGPLLFDVLLLLL